MKFLSQFLYQQALTTSSKLYYKILLRLRGVLLRLCDPLITTTFRQNLALLMDYTKDSSQIHYYDVLAIPSQSAFNLQEYLQLYTKQNTQAREWI